jgi:hypothetical protein
MFVASSFCDFGRIVTALISYDGQKQLLETSACAVECAWWATFLGPSRRNKIDHKVQ